VFRARPSTTGISLREYLDLTDADFRALFKTSPIKRIKRRGFLRNVCVALGNVGDSSDLPALERAAADREPLIAEHAAWAIQQIRDREKPEQPRSFESKSVAHCIQRIEGHERAPLARV
jgi:epoxyqueuosine reductase